MRFTAIAASLAFCSLLNGFGQSPSLPSSVLNLTNWKITLPVNTSHAGNPDEILQPELAGFEDLNYFHVNGTGNAVVFTAPCGGATTGGSSYPRSELREMTNNGSDQASWSTSSGTHTMEITQAITHLPVVKAHVVAGQIHDADDDVLVCRLEGTELFFDENGNRGPVLTTGYRPGDIFTIKFIAQNGGIECYYNGQYIYTYRVNASGCYFKAGCYTQSNPDRGDEPTAYGEVVIYGLLVNAPTGPTADLAVLKTGPTVVLPGTNFNYTISVTNLGPMAATNVTVKDFLPGSVTFVSASGGGLFSGGVVSWPVMPFLDVGAGMSFTVRVAAPGSGTFTNRASATAITPDPNPGNNSGTGVGLQVITTVAPQADVATTCSGPASVGVGVTFNYSVTVTNLGPAVASNVVVMDTLPAVVTVLSATGGGVNSGGVISWPTIAAMPSGGTASFTVTVVAPATGLLTNTVSSVASTQDPVVSNNDGSANAARVVTTVSVAAAADLVVFKTGPPAVLPGTNFNYTISVTNLGPATAINIAVTDFLPDSVTFVSASGGGSFSNGIVSWPVVPLLDVGAGRSFTATVTAPASGVFTNRAVSTAITPDPISTNNDGTSPDSQAITIVATPAQLSVLAGAITLNPQNGRFEQSVTVTNTGTGAAAAVRLYVEGLRSAVQLLNAAGTNAGRAYVQYNSPLAPNQAVTFFLKFYVPDRASFTDVLQAEAVFPLSAPLVSGGFAINRIFMDLTTPGSPRVVIEFNTIPGRRYLVIYSDDGMKSWNAVTPAITATATVTQWYDDGPPETVSKPGLGGSRAYRVIANHVTP